jgi:hypothetical protein
MALKPDDQYEYQICTACHEQKKVHDGVELLWYWEEWIAPNNETCMICRRDEIMARLGLITDRKIDDKGRPVPILSDWYMMYKESVRPPKVNTPL